MGRPWRAAAVFVAVLVSLGACGSGAQFAQPQPWPGIPWTKDGQQVPASVVEASAGPEFCGLKSATFLTMGWPPGTHAHFATQARQYVRDPKGVVRRSNLRSSLELHAKLPSDAKPTGYKDGAAELYLAPSDEDVAAYIVQGTQAERWPRSDPMTVCS